MDGMLLGIAMLVSSTVGSPAVQPVRAAIVPTTFTFELSAVRPEPPRPVSRRAAFQIAKAPRAKPAAKTERMILGFLIGTIAGAALGQAVASGDGELAAVRITVPVGGLAGALIGYSMGR